MSDRSEPIVTRTTEQPCTLLAVMANDDVMDLLFEHVDYEDWQRLDRLNKTARGAINSMIARNWDK
jgi:predicted hydrolase (HD superfamily)